MAKSYLPTKNYTKPFWLQYEDKDPFSTYQSSEKLPEETDILIIGSGYSGTATAYTLFQKDPSLDVTLLEARTVCSGATGRNGGHVKPYSHRDYYKYELEHGPKVAAQVVNSEVDCLYTLKKLAEEEQIDCDFILTRAFDVYKEETRFKKDLLSFEKMKENPYVKDEIKSSIQVVEGENVAILSKTPGTRYGITYPAAHIWPWKLITGLLKKTVAKGLKLYTNTPVEKFDKSKDGSYIVSTPKGDVIAKQIVFATNAYTKALLKEFTDEIIPVKGVVTHINSNDYPIPQLSHTYGVFAKSPLHSEYLINRADGGIVVGGGASSMITENGDSTEVYDNPDDSYLTERAKDYFQNYMKREFTTWNNSTNDYTWSGIMGYTKNNFPFVGELDFLDLPNAYIVAGFTGHGMPRVYFSGQTIANSILTGKSVQELAEVPECYMASAERLKKSKKEEHEYAVIIKNYLKTKL